MFLHSNQAKSLVEILDITALIDPLKKEIRGKIQSGQEEQDPEMFAKDDLIFPSGENLPQCWLDANYRDQN